MSSRIWEDLSSLFPEAEHHYIDYTHCTEPEHYRAAVRRLLASGDSRPWSLVGWSLGGILALEEVICGQLCVDSVVLIGATLKFTADDRAKGWPKRVLERMIKQVRCDPQAVVESFAAAMLTQEELELADRQRLLEYAAEAVPETADSLAAGLGLLLESDLTGRWAAWRAQAEGGQGAAKPRLLWIHGQADAICPPGAMPDDLTERERSVLAAAGHAPMVTQRARLEHELRGFWHGD
ncbi:alpha/beta fold hydrolase [Paenibacillus athensensis]|uniref:AB hydrolase-1 domain-containing protein n=2 Tax=Paenibacillus athensensis TaxID=1967502 RepID=A0A4Y8PVP0_9BACL|nr:alpha/beta fold hydrolase [Paenibacillus athensensis]